MNNDMKTVIKMIIYILSVIVVNQMLINVGVDYIAEND